MSSDSSWDQIEELFARGLHASDVERDALLADCDGEPAAHVRALWARSQQAGSFLERGIIHDRRLVSYAPGQQIGGRFTLMEPLGTGGMGEVFAARDEKLGRLVALKFLNADLASQEETRHHLEREARAVSALAHPNICTVHDLCWQDETPFLVMERLVGETLAERLTTGPMPLSEVVRLALQMLDGLEHAHSAGIVHRDLKPANVMLTRQGVKILDFGIAKHLPGSSSANPFTTIASDGILVGSSAYMSPEQAQGKPVDARSDIFSFGCVFYEMITGHKTFAGESPIATLVAVLESEPVPIDHLISGIPDRLRQLVEHCLRKNPDARPQTIEQVRRAIAEIPSGSPVAAATEQSFDVRSLARKVLRTPRRLATVVGSTIALVSIAAVLVFYTTGPAEAADSVAVLPFANMDNDATLDYLADGLAESITNALSRLSAVRVVARTTAFAYRGRETDVRKLSQDLNVRAIVTGRVSRAQNRLRVQADLVDASAGTQLWGNRYEGTTDDILRIQEDMVRNIAQRLRADVTDTNSEQLTKSSTSKPEAYELYLRGRYALSRSTVADTQKGIEFFQMALESDPTYPSAYVGLADSYLGLSGMFLRPKDAMVKAKAAVTRALELDPALAEAHVSKGVTLAFHDFNWRESEEEFKRAIELNPYDAGVRLWYAWNLVLTGRSAAGIAQAQRAHELDPLSAYVETGLGQMYYCSGEPQIAIQRLRNVVGADPNFFNGHYLLGVAYLYTRQYADAIGELEHARQLDPQQPQPLGYLAYAYAKTGDSRTAQERLATLKKMSEARYVSAYLFAVAAAGFGRTDEAIDWLRRAYDDRDDMLSVLRVDSPFADLRSDARVIALLKQIGLN